MLNIAVCDDSMLDREIVRNMLEKYESGNNHFSLGVHIFETADDLLEEIEDGRVFDLYLFDIIMPDMNGINLARIIRKKNRNTPIMFLTGSVQYALEAYRVNAVSYLLKPLNEIELFQALDKAISMRSTEKSLFVPLQEGGVSVNFCDILYVEVLNRVMSVHLLNGKTLVSEILRMNFVAATSPLSSDERFIKIRGSCMLNMEQVKSFSSGVFVLKNNEEVSVPNARRAEVNRKYRNYVKKS